MIEPHSTDYCTTREAASLLGISVRTAQMWVESGKLQAWKTPGGHRRIPLESVRRLQSAERPLQPEKRTSQLLTTPNTAENLRVLVVEDDNLLLRLYKTHMSSWGLPLEVITARNGMEGLLLIGRTSPDLLISDLIMPAMDGFEMLRTLSRTSYRDGMEMVVVTSLDAEAIARAGGLPADIPVFRKPVQFAELRALCEKLLKSRAALAR